MNFEVNFVLPHWLYWSFLLIGPLVALYYQVLTSS